MHQAGCIVPAGQRTNLLQKLHLRQLYGSMRAGSRAEEQKVFSRLPGRLAFFIRDVVPHSALTAGHVFLGFSRCGQFLISYTQTSTENDQFDLNFNYYYRLHWWLFTPYSKARKIAEVTLFTDSGVYGNLRISVCQWPGDLTKLLVYGSQQSGECSDPGQSGSLHCYLTVTAVPSLQNCPACVGVANSYDADDMAAAWDSCVRLSCLRHGATVHTQFDLVAPYPRFEPRVSLKRDNCVVVNTGNFLHSVTVDLEQLRGVEGMAGQPSGLPHSTNPAPASLAHPISVNIGLAEFSLLGSPTGFSPAWSSLSSDCGEEGEAEARQGQQADTTERRERVSDFSQLLKLKKPKYSPFKNLCIKDLEEDADSFEFTVPSSSSKGIISEKKRIMADAAYELTEANFDVGISEKLSTFRKKRLAEKKYEFTEDEFDSEGDSEKKNFKPLTRSRSRKMAELCQAEEELKEAELSSMMVEGGGEVMVCVSKGEDPDTAQNEYWTDVMASTTYPELLSPGGCIKKDAGNAASTCLSPRISHGNNDIFCTANYTRRYLEVDDELISVITDVEEDELGTTTGYHSALPLEVHGAGYTNADGVQQQG
jgi:hypothetical protein